MLAVERRNRILEQLHEEKRVLVSELSQTFCVSEETIRRDLEKLEQEGLAIKSYGGAILNDNTSIEVPFNVRKKSNVPGKQEIAELIAAMVQEGERIMLDASTTSVFIAKALKEKQHLTVVTNSIENMLELSDMQDWTLLSSGGRLRGEYLALYGPVAEEGLRRYYADKAILSCKAFDLQRGYMDSREEFSTLKRTMMQCAREVILAVDSSKFGKQSFSVIGDLSNLTAIVTDQEPAQEWKRQFEQNGVRCYYPGSDQ